MTLACPHICTSCRAYTVSVSTLPMRSVSENGLRTCNTRALSPVIAPTLPERDGFVCAARDFVCRANHYWHSYLDIYCFAHSRSDVPGTFFVENKSRLRWPCSEWKLIWCTCLEYCLLWDAYQKHDLSYWACFEYNPINVVPVFAGVPNQLLKKSRNLRKKSRGIIWLFVWQLSKKCCTAFLFLN